MIMRPDARAGPARYSNRTSFEVPSSRIMRHCLEPHCQTLVQHGRCTLHTRVDEHRKGSAYRRGYDRHWRWLRDYKLQLAPLCERCQRRGTTEPAREVHHIVSIEADPSRRLDLSNLESLCVQCHRDETAQRR